MGYAADCMKSGAGGALRQSKAALAQRDWGKDGKRLAKFGAMVLSAALAIQGVSYLKGLPPADEAFAFAQGQTSTQISLDKLAERTDYFNVKGQAGFVVDAPEGKAFVFAGGAQGKQSAFVMKANSSRAYEFSVMDLKTKKVETRKVWFRTFSFSGYSSQKNLPYYADYITRKVQNGKYTNTVVDGVRLRYRLDEGQKAAELPVPLIPKDDCGCGRVGYENALRFEVQAAEGQYRASIVAPEGMKFVFGNGTAVQRYDLDVPARSRSEWTFVLQDEGKAVYPVKIGLDSSQAPKPQKL